MSELDAQELERVKALRGYNILDTFSETEFDRLTELATIICNTPMSKVSLVDDKRQWFKSKIGIPFEETSRDIALCVHCINTKNFLYVEDTLQHANFKDNPLVTGPPNIRFYAGCPLTDPNGHVLGTLSVMDVEPRTLNEEQIKSLKLIAQEVMGAIIERKRKEELKTYKELLKASEDFTAIFDKEGNVLMVNRAFYESLGWDEETIKHKLDEIIHPDDKASAQEKFEKLLQGEPIINYGQRIKTSEGEYRSVQWKANTEPISGNILAVGRDITEELQIKSEIIKQKDFLDSIMQGMQEGFALADVEGVQIKVNEALCKMTGFAEEELVGRRPPYAYWPKDRAKKNSYFFTKALQEKPGTTQFELILQRKNGERFPAIIRTSIIKDPSTEQRFIFATFQDISKAKKIEQKLSITQKMMEQTNRVANVGGWDVDLESDTLYWSEITREIHEVPPGIVITLADGLNYYKPGYSADTIREHWSKCVEKGIPFDLELEIITHTGKPKWVRTKSQCEIRNGKVTRVYGTFQDITQKKHTELTIAKKEKMLKGISMATDQLLSHRKFENAIEKSLQILGKTVETDRVYLFENHEDEEGIPMASQIYEYNSGKCQSSITPDQLQNIPHSSFEAFFTPLKETLPLLPKSVI